MKVTRIEIEGVMYRVVKDKEGSTYCDECDLHKMCLRKNEEDFPCKIIGKEEIFEKE